MQVVIRGGIVIAITMRSGTTRHDGTTVYSRGATGGIIYSCKEHGGLGGRSDLSELIDRPPCGRIRRE
jgi:hypothetical protein